MRTALALVRADALPRPGSEDWTLLQKLLDRFRALDVLSSIDFNALAEEFKAQAFSLAGVWNTRFLAAVLDSLSTAMSDGLSAREWLSSASQIIKVYGGTTNLGVFGANLTGESFSPAYADLVFRMATTNALNAARYSSMFFGPRVETDPFWLFATAEDDRVCEICEPLDGMVFAKDDVESLNFLPPLHFGSCRCQAIELDAAAVAAGSYTITRARDITSRRPDFDTNRLDLVPDALRRAA